jgi:hypothetical protein
VARRRGTEPAAVVGGGGGAPVSERAWGLAVQLWCEVEKVMGGLVWAMWGWSSASTRGWQLTGVGLGAASSGALGGAFMGARERGWRPGHELLGKVRPRHPNLRARLPRCHRRGSLWRQQRPQQKHAAAWRVPKGESGILWASEGSPGCWQAHLAGRLSCARVHWLGGLPAMGQGRGRRQQ